MIYLASNVDLPYYQQSHADWIFSTLKHKKHDQQLLLFQIDFDQEIENGINIVIPRNELKYSSHSNIPNRTSYTCLESGEFVHMLDNHTHDFKDDDILILCDWDVTMQRPLSEEEVNILNSLDVNEFALNLDKYPAFHLIQSDYWSPERTAKANVSANGYLGMCDIFDDIHPDWILYNCGVQAGRISAWREVFEYWKQYLPAINANMKHHALYQGLFNYIVQKHMKVKLMPPNFHNAFWFPGTPAVDKNNQLLYNNEPVAFNHHKFQRRPNF